MTNADRLAVSVTHADGSVTRWGAGEATDRLLNDLTFSSTSPGGFEGMACSLLRNLTPGPDEHLVDTVTVYGPGGRVAYEGRVQQLPRETGDANRLSVQVVGWSSHLQDRKVPGVIYVDRSAGQWAPPSLNRRVALTASNNDIASVSWANDSGLSAALPNQPLGISVVAEAWYTAPPGVTIDQVIYKGVESVPAGYESARFNTYTDDSGSGLAAYTITLDNGVRSVAITTPRRYIVAPVYSNGTAATPASGDQRTFTKLAVYGHTGLTTRTISGEPNGIYVSDIIGHAVSTYAPLLTYTAGSLQPNTYIVPQAAYQSFTTAADIVADVNKYVGWDWFVWEDKTFYFQQAGSGVEWRARRSDGAKLSLDGSSADVILTAIYVAYTDGYGNNRTAGPPGSGCDVEDASLQDTNPENPYVAHSVPERSDAISLSQPVTDADAVAIGAWSLYDRNAATRRSRITLTGTVEHPTEGRVPVWRVRAGDSIIVSDYPSDVPRRILKANYQHANRTVQLDLDNTPAALDAMLARLVAGQSFYT